MKIIESSATLVKEQNENKRVELFGKISWKSEGNITDISYKRFIKNILIAGHTAVLEGYSVYLRVIDGFDFNMNYDVTSDFYESEFVHVSEVGLNGFILYTNLRYILDNIPALASDIINDTLPGCIEIHVPKDNDPYKRYMFKIVTNRGISHELVRHRIMSPLQESTRYCNYSNSKFGNELTIIRPNWMSDEDLQLLNENKIAELSSKAISWRHAMVVCENTYFDLLSLKATPQEARGVLPNDLKTELYMCGFLKDWIGEVESKFNITVYDEEIECKRLKGFDTLRNSKSAHPQAIILAKDIKNEIIKLIGIQEFTEIKNQIF